nr:aminotransferase class III-fold pyridoxal phosphate-dependent enzyme [Bradyrhizobium barranii]
MEIAPEGFDHTFLAGSGSEAVDTALKMALAYHRARGEGHRQRLIGRQRSYHGMGFAGLSVSGIGWQRAQFGVMLPGVSRLPHTHDLTRNAFSKGEPEHGVEFADALEGLDRDGPLDGRSRDRRNCFENGIFVRAVGDTLILSPPLIINEEQIGQIADGIKSGIRTL